MSTTDHQLSDEVLQFFIPFSFSLTLISPALIFFHWPLPFTVSERSQKSTQVTRRERETDIENERERERERAKKAKKEAKASQNQNQVQ